MTERMIPTMDLVDFLLARIADDEEVARAAVDPDRPGTHWHWVMDGNDTPVRPGHLEGAQEEQTISLRTIEETETRSGVGPLPHFVIHSLQDVHPGGGEHIARWDPARVLAECEAKRRLIELHKLVTEDYTGHWWTDPGPPEKYVTTGCDHCRSAGVDGEDYVNPGPCPTLRILATVYANHPAYRQEWRP